MVSEFEFNRKNGLNSIKKDERDGEDDIAVENVAMAEVLFDGLKDYSFM